LSSVFHCSFSENTAKRMATAALTGELRKKSNSHGMNQLRHFVFNRETRFLQYFEASGEPVKGSGTVTAVGNVPDGGWSIFQRRHRFNLYMEHHQRGGPSVVECTATSAEQKREWLDAGSLLGTGLLGTAMVTMPAADDGQDLLPPAGASPPTLPVAVPCQPDLGHVKCHSWSSAGVLGRRTWTSGEDFTTDLLDSASPLPAGGGGGGGLPCRLSSAEGSAAGSHGTPFGSYFPASSYELRSQISHRAEAAQRDQAAAQALLEAARQQQQATEHMRAADQARAEAAEREKEAAEREKEATALAATAAATAAAEMGEELREELEEKDELCGHLVLHEDRKNDVIDRMKERLRAAGVPENEISELASVQR
jgi:hypothetical protein